jgi:hypothetical protein
MVVDVNNMVLGIVSLAAAEACSVAVNNPPGKSAERVSSGGIKSGVSSSADCLRKLAGLKRLDLSRRTGAAVGVDVALAGDVETVADVGASDATDAGELASVDEEDEVSVVGVIVSLVVDEDDDDNMAEALAEEDKETP